MKIGNNNCRKNQRKMHLKRDMKPLNEAAQFITEIALYFKV